MNLTSSLRRERNINRAFIKEKKEQTMRHFYIRFIRELLCRNYNRNEIRLVCRDIKPFFDYLGNVAHVKSIKGIRFFHIKEYADIIKHSCTASTTLMTVLDGNGKLDALKMFCLQMFVAGVFPDDYANNIGYIEYPRTRRQNERNKGTGLIYKGLFS